MLLFKVDPKEIVSIKLFKNLHIYTSILNFYVINRNVINYMYLIHL